MTTPLDLLAAPMAVRLQAILHAHLVELPTDDDGYVTITDDEVGQLLGRRARTVRTVWYGLRDAGVVEIVSTVHGVRRVHVLDEAVSL